MIFESSDVHCIKYKFYRISESIVTSKVLNLQHMKMSHTPDYFISGTGLPKLNHKKYKRLRKSTEKSEPDTNILPHKIILKTNLLNKRENNQVVTAINIIGTNTKRPILLTDKDLKSAINQRIKMIEETTENSSDSNEMLDNRLNYKRTYSNGVFGYNNQTDTLLDDMVLPPLNI